LVDFDLVVIARLCLPGGRSRLYEVGDDAERGALGDAERGGDLPQPHPGVLGDTQQRLSVVCQEAPSHEL
jgi:hypothetical protein